MMLAGMVGMSESEFWRTSLRYLTNRIEGWHKAREIEIQAQYEVARYNAMLVLSPNVKKGTRLKPHDLGKFLWEMSEQERAALEPKGPADNSRVAELQDKLFAGLENGTIRWEAAKLEELAP